MSKIILNKVNILKIFLSYENNNYQIPNSKIQILFFQILPLVIKGQWKIDVIPHRRHPINAGLLIHRNLKYCK